MHASAPKSILLVHDTSAARRELPHSPVGFRLLHMRVFALVATIGRRIVRTADKDCPRYFPPSSGIMDKPGGFWKPGEAKPTLNDAADKPGNHGGDHEANDSTSFLAVSKDRHHRGSRGESMNESKGRDINRAGRQSSAGGHDTGIKKGTGKGKGKRRHKSLEQTIFHGQKEKLGLCGGPSQGLLAMKFMQRKARIEEARQEKKDRKAKLDRDFSTPYAKRLKTDTNKDRLVCRPDEQDPGLVVLGRRSFGGFNAMAEAAYDACIKEIEAGARFILAPMENYESDSGVSDTEMADRLGKNVRLGDR